MLKHLYFVLLTIAFLLYQSCSFVLATTTTSNPSSLNIEKTLSQLEDRFFEHQYDNDADADRINRLEQFIFGCTQTGSVNDRLQHILSAIPDDLTNKIMTANTSLSNSDSDEQSTIYNTNQQTTNNFAYDITDSTSNNFDYSSYPRVTNLEQELLGHTYINDSVTNRLARLETKAFGAPSTIADLGERTDNLDDYAQRHDIYGTRQIANNTNNTLAFVPSKNNRNPDLINSSPAAQANYNDGQRQYISKTGSFVGSVEERVSMMEAQAFGHTYPDRSLDKRLKKLEGKLLANQDNSQLGLFERTGKLWVVLHPTDKSKVDKFLANNKLVGNRIVSIQPSSDSTNIASINNTSNSVNTSINSTNTNNTTSSTNTVKRHSWLSKLANSIGSPGYSGNSTIASNQSFTYPYPGMYTYTGGPPPPGYTSRSYGISVGPGAGPFGVPLGFW